jgi:leader peptidase (prepilin peptidase)/N-methyltransferase
MEDALALAGQRLPWLLPGFAFAFGAVVGSFLNVVIARVPAGESIVAPRSRCPRCKSQLAWFENVPLVSWLLLRARCRHCGQPISARYPVVELLLGLLAVALEKRFGFAPAALGYFAFAAALVALAYIDLDTWLLPHQITWPLIAVGLASPLWNRALGFRESAFGAALGFAAFAAVALFGEKVLRRETMGWGDVWLLAGIGAWLGFKALLPVVLLSSLQGAVAGLALIALGRDPSRREESPAQDAPPAPADSAAPPSLDGPPSAAAQDAGRAPKNPLDDDDWVPPRHAVPFGPFLALAALEVLLVGPALFAAWDRLLVRVFW